MKKKQIGLLTYQNTTNFGAALQCYALFKKVEEFGNDIEVINYDNQKISHSINALSIASQRGKVKVTPLRLMKALFIFPLLKSKVASFRKFDKRFLKISKKSYKKEFEIQKSPPIYDIYLLGSDQLWNHNINGLDTTYFMDFVNDTSKIKTFATSFGLTEIENSKKEIYQKYLNRIPEISVREPEGKKIVKELTGRNAVLNNDPTFLLSKNEWEESFNIKSLPNKNYVTYFLNFQTRTKCEKLLSEEKNLFKNLKRIKLAGGIKIKDYINKNTHIKYSNGPIEFVSSISNAKYVLTDSFHGVVFSIIFNKPFLVFLSGDEGRDSRIKNLLAIFNLENQIFKNDLSPLKVDLNIYEVNNKLKLIKENNLKYLKSIL